MILLPIQKAKFRNTASFLLSSTSDKIITILQDIAINFFDLFKRTFNFFSMILFQK